MRISKLTKSYLNLQETYFFFYVLVVSSPSVLIQGSFTPQRYGDARDTGLIQTMQSFENGLQHDSEVTLDCFQ